MLRLLVGAGLGLVLMLLVVATASSVALAQDRSGLDVSASTVFTPVIETASIEVRSTYVLTNQQADDVLGDTVRSYYFDRWIIAVPATATDLVAETNGQSLATTAEPSDGNGDVNFVTIDFPTNLNFEQTVTITVSYSTPGAEPRTQGTVARVNQSFLSFPVWTAGDPGQTDVTVVIPDGFRMETDGQLDQLQPSIRDGSPILEALDIANPRAFFGRVYGRNDEGLLAETAELPGATATVRAWPDDPEWAEFVVDAIEDDVPIIEELTGLQWPAGDIEIIETVTPFLYGYGGWFNASSGTIEIGDALERELILHELTHAWFNNDFVTGRWITEGLAEEYASRAIEAAGDPRPDPDPPDLDDPIRVPLDAWANPWTQSEEDAFAYEQYHYNASWWVIRQISDSIGLEQLAEVLADVDTDDIAYRGEGPVEQTRTETQWTHFFDLLDRHTNVPGLDELFATYVLVPGDVPLLDRRRAVLQNYDALNERAGDWGPPLVVRRHLSDWNFADADEALEQAAQVIDGRDRANRLAVSLEVMVRHEAEALYEGAINVDDLERAIDLEQQLNDQLDELQDRREQLGALARQRGVAISTARPTLAEALEAASNARVQLAALGDLQAKAEEQAAALGLTMPPWNSAASAAPEATDADRDADAMASLAEARRVTLAAIADVSEAADTAPTWLERVGRWRRDPREPLAQARSAFEADELDVALAATAETEQRLSTASVVGRNRVAAAGAITLALLLMSAVLLWRWRARYDTRVAKRRPKSPITSPR